MAAADYNELVQELYISYFGRPADPRGLENFSKALDALEAPTDIDGLVEALASPAGQNTTLKSLINNSFSNSDEAKALYTNADNLAFVGQIYKNVLNRVGDAEGLIYWANKLDNHELSRENAAIAIMQGALTNDTAQGQLDAKLVTTKVAVAGSFTTAIDTGDELLAYSGNAAAATARDMLSQITPTTDATAFQATVNSTLQTLVSNANPGQTFTLTAGADTSTGGAGNDVFKALSINAAGAAASTLSDFDTLNGGAGVDTLEIYTTGTENASLPATATITNIENIVINNTGAAAALANAAKYVGVTNLTQVGAAAAVTNLKATTTATFKQLSTAALSVSAAAGVASANVALNAVAEASTLTVAGDSLDTVNLSGTRADTNADGSIPSLALTVTAGEDVQTINVNTSVKSTLTINDTASTDKVTTVNLAGSTAGVTFVGDADVASITGGSAADTLTLGTTTVKAATGVTAVTGTVSGGAGNDKITVTTTGDGATNVDAGAGNDTVTITTRGSGKLTVALGDGTDTFSSAVAIEAGDSIDAGAGSDTLALKLVGSANIGAFAGFDVFDVAGMGNTQLDVDILATKNTVTEFIASGDTGNAATALLNVGAGVGFRATGDMGAGVITLTQKTAGALTVTVDADETGDADTAIDTATASVKATNATSVKAVFATDYLAKITGETTTGDNITTLNLTTTAATSVEVASGGTGSHNVLSLTDLGSSGGKLASLTITGAQDLTLTGSTPKLATIDASASTGGLTASIASLAETGTIKLGSGVDMITLTVATTAAGVESLQGFEKASATAVSTTASASAVADAIADADMLSFTGAVAADGGNVENGVYTFTGAGASNLTNAIATIDTAVATAGNTVAFQYLNDTYVFVQGGAAGTADDIVVKLTGVTGVTNLVEDGTTNHFFIV